MRDLLKVLSPKLGEEEAFKKLAYELGIILVVCGVVYLISNHPYIFEGH